MVTDRSHRICRGIALAAGLATVLMLSGTRYADAAPKKKPAPAAAKKATKKKNPEKVTEPPPPLAPAPSPEDPKARLAWAESEARLQRDSVQRTKSDATRIVLAGIAIEAARDLERALARADIDTAGAFRKVIVDQLHDTRWRLGRLAERGDGGAEFALGVMQLHGVLEQQDPLAACARFAAAWEKRFADSAFRHARCIEEKQPDQAGKVLEVAANAGHAEASERLGRKCLEARPPDATCAASRLEAAAAAGRNASKSLLGWMRAQGIGGPPDLPRAVSLYTAAAEAGDLPAKNNLGELYETGRGVPQDVRRAFVYYREAAEGGFAPGQFNVGRMYASGNGIERDTAAAYRWLRAASKAGIEPAQTLIDWLDKQAPAEPAR
jgi:TPR repeat protein